MATRSHQASPIPDRSSFTPLDTVKHIWRHLDLPSAALPSLHLEPATHHFYPSSFKIDHLAQSTLALSALAAALVASLHHPSHTLPHVSIPLKPASLAFRSERLYTLDGHPPASTWGPIGGLHATVDGHVRIHDSFPHHRSGALALLGLDAEATRAQVAEMVKRWPRFELEDRAAAVGLPIYALRTYEEWDIHPAGAAIGDLPITLRKINHTGPQGLPPHLSRKPDRPLRGLRVLDLSRVIAAPVAGQTLAAHGADVLWITSPSLPALPALDRCFARGKRTLQLDLDDPADRATLEALVRDADVWLQGYRPDALAGKGFGARELRRWNPGIIIADLSAFPADGPWASRRGFDSLVQTCSGMNSAEAARAGGGEVARPMPCQALDHGAGYLLAAGIAGAVWRRAIERGAWEVSVSLAGVGAFLRSLGQWDRREGFEGARGVEGMEELVRKDAELFESRESGFGTLKALRHAARVEGMMPGWDVMPKPLGSDEARWL